MLSKKYVVQKSVRIDAKLQDDLETLSDILGRSQNELINFALENLMQDNKEWFAQNILVEYFQHFLDAGDEHEHYEIGGVEIDLDIRPDFSTQMYFRYKDKNGKILDTYEKNYPDDSTANERIVNELRQIAFVYLVNKTEIIEPYLKERLNYR